MFFIGLEDGLIWDVMHNQPHPLNVTYEQLWDFVNCLEINPCWYALRNDGWATFARKCCLAVDGRIIHLFVCVWWGWTGVG